VQKRRSNREARACSILLPFFFFVVVVVVVVGGRSEGSGKVRAEVKATVGKGAD